MSTMPALGVLLAGLLCGCSYRMGAGAETTFRSITVEAVKNDSYAPQVQAELHRGLHDALASEHALHVVDSGGQARLRVALFDYRREVGAVNPRDTVLAASQVFRLSAKITLTDAASGKVLVRDRVVTASMSAYAPDGVNRTETQTQGLLLRELSRRIRDTVADVW